MSVAREQAVVVGAMLEGGRRLARAVLVGVDGSAPLSPGASMYVADDGAIEGSITGGCVESALVQEAERVLAGEPARTVAYGISDELAGTAGLTCGGTVHVFVHAVEEPAAAALALALERVAGGRAVALATALDGARPGALMAVAGEGEATGSLGGPALLDASVARDAAGMLEQALTGVRSYGSDGATLGAELRVHVSSSATPPQLLVFGAIDFTAALVPLAQELGYRVTVSDPRERFVRAPRFARAEEVHVGWPDALYAGRTLGPRDAVVVLSHDPRLDVPALLGALATDVGYVGALGSRRTTADRNERLREAGASERQIARIHAPCGLDIGGGTPGETAISILAEIVASRSRRPAAPLRETSGSIQH